MLRAWAKTNIIMKNFGIYQLFIDPIKGECRLLVGFSVADSENAAIKNFTTDKFRQGYLNAVECNKEDLTKQHLIDAIELNIKGLGAWAKTHNELSNCIKPDVSKSVCEHRWTHLSGFRENELMKCLKCGAIG